MVLIACASFKVALPQSIRSSANKSEWIVGALTPREMPARLLFLSASCNLIESSLIAITKR
jgi:hypothetical protein